MKDCIINKKYLSKIVIIQHADIYDTKFKVIEPQDSHHFAKK